MYILVNNRPFNILNLKISDIKHLDKDMLSPFVDSFLKIRVTTTEMQDFIERFKNRNILEIEYLGKEEFDKKYSHIFISKNHPGLIATQDGYRIQLIKFDPEKWFFFIRDKERAEISEPYNTLEEAEEARNRLLSSVNKIFASLKRVEI